MISAEAPILFAKACEMFILELTLRSWYQTEEFKRRTLQVGSSHARARPYCALCDAFRLSELLLVCSGLMYPQRSKTLKYLIFSSTPSRMTSKSVAAILAYSPLRSLG